MPRETERGEGKAGCEGVMGENVGAEGVRGETPIECTVESGAIEETTDDEGELEKNDLGAWS